jgi:hypothetical protein
MAGDANRTETATVNLQIIGMQFQLENSKEK